jgi:predicted HicB family RNase H-like nuclease
MKTKDIDIERPSLATIKRGHRVTREEHDEFRRALSKPGHLLPSRMGRPPKGADRGISMTMRVPPTVLARLKAKAHKLGIKYQTFINQVLTVAAA